MVCSKVASLIDSNSGCQCTESSGDLSCTCPNTHGDEVTTTLKQSSSCNIKFVYDGRLGCFPFRGTAVPSCPRYVFKYGLAKAECNDGNGGTFVATLDVTPCKNFVLNLDQTNKKLVCEKVLKSWS